MSNVKVTPRHDMVLCRIVTVDKRDGLYVPQVSQEGKQYRVEALGPDVKPLLKVGDLVLCMGQKGVDYDFMPGYSDLFVIPDRKVVLTYEETLD